MTKDNMTSAPLDEVIDTFLQSGSRSASLFNNDGERIVCLIRPDVLEEFIAQSSKYKVIEEIMEDITPLVKEAHLGGESKGIVLGDEHASKILSHISLVIIDDEGCKLTEPTEEQLKEMKGENK